MIGNAVVRKAVQVEYTMLRAPLTVLDQQVVARYFDESSVVRSSFARGLDVLDSAAARLLQPERTAAQRQEPGRPEPARQQPDRPEQAPRQPASSGSQPARSRRRATPPQAAATSDAEELPEEEQHEVQELAGELLEQEETETFTGELADEDMRRVQAELRAKHTVEEQTEHNQP
ncbi:MAG TPA: hypothetical protein VFH38_00220 [Jatrophihabitans sp.]|nr:hypothetical protein [Jatrophihabitans sp.]